MQYLDAVLNANLTLRQRAHSQCSVLACNIKCPFVNKNQWMLESCSQDTKEAIICIIIDMMYGSIQFTNLYQINS